MDYTLFVEANKFHNFSFIFVTLVWAKFKEQEIVCLFVLF